MSQPNRFIGRYASFETNFNRTDPWKHIPWKEDPTPLWKKILLGACFTLVITLTLGFSQIPLAVPQSPPPPQMCKTIAPNAIECVEIDYGTEPSNN